MAEGGSSFCTYTDGSDFIHAFPCIPCEKDGRNVAAVKHCVDCDENLCQTCLTQHSKFGLMRGHKVLDGVQSCQGKIKQLPRQRCAEHGGKPIDIYCPDHDDVGCSTCFATKHKSCEDIKFVPDVAPGIKTSDELHQLENTMKYMKSRLASLRTQKLTNIARFKQDKDTLQKEIRLIRKRLNTQLDKMEKDLQNEVESKFNDKIKDINAMIAEIDSALKQMNERIKELKQNNHESDIFVSVKTGKRDTFTEVEDLMNREHIHSLKLHIDKTAQQIIDGQYRFAVLVNKINIQKVEDVSEDINIHLQDDTNNCEVISWCTLPDDSLVMADCFNKKLKKLDMKSKRVSTLIEMSNTIHSVCRIDTTMLAVSVMDLKAIQFVYLNAPVRLGRMFSIGDYCRGLSYCDGLLYVCCGGSWNKSDREGPGHVNVYDLSGELVQSLYKDLSFPVRISVIKTGDDSEMYISDNVTGVQLKDMDGFLKHHFPTAVDTSLPFSVVRKKQLLIGERRSQAIYMHTDNNKTLLLVKDVLKGEPSALHVDEKSSRLFVSFYSSDIIKVFKLKL